MRRGRKQKSDSSLSELQSPLDTLLRFHQFVKLFSRFAWPDLEELCNYSLNNGAPRQFDWLNGNEHHYVKQTQTVELPSVSRIRFPSCQRAREWEQSLAGTRDYVTDLNSKFHQNGKVERACCIMAVPSATCGAAKSSTREFTRRPRPNYSSEQVNLRAPEKFWRQARCQKLLWRVWTLTSGAHCDYVGVNIHR